jgi:hypothetical protein
MTDLATMDDFANALGKPTADPTDQKARSALNLASAIVRAWTSQQFDLVENDVVDCDGTGTYRIQLPQVPVVAVTTIEQFDWYGQVVANPASFLTRIDRDSGLIARVDDRWTIGYSNWRFTYAHGFVMPGTTYSGPLAVEPLPDLVRQKVASIAGSLYALDPSGGVVESYHIGNFGENLKHFVDTSGPFQPELSALAKYRVVDAA